MTLPVSCRITRLKAGPIATGLSKKDGVAILRVLGSYVHITLLRRGILPLAGKLADQVPVAVDVVHAVDRRPVFVDAERTRGETPLFAGVGPVPVGHEVFDRMRRVFQRVVFAGISPVSIARISSRIASIASQNRSSSALVSDSVGSTIKVPATGQTSLARGTRIHQTLGDVVHRDMRAVCKRARVDDALMRDAPCWALIQHIERPSSRLAM